MDWAHFDSIYLVVHRRSVRRKSCALLGADADPAVNLQNTLDQVTARIQQVSGRELFSLYSRGSVLVEMRNYIEAAQAFDQAFAVYAELPAGERPWRITWYQWSLSGVLLYRAVSDCLDIALQTITNTSIPSCPKPGIGLGVPPRSAKSDDASLITEKRSSTNRVGRL